MRPRPVLDVPPRMLSRLHLARSAPLLGLSEGQPLRLDETPFFQALQSRATRGTAWEGSEYHARLLAALPFQHGAAAYRQPSEIEAWLSCLDRQLGLPALAGTPELAGTTGATAHGELASPVEAHLDRQGRFVLAAGVAAAAIARLRGDSRLPVRILSRHWRWRLFSLDINGYARHRSGRIYQRLPHPDLDDVPAWHGGERFDLIRPHLPSTPGLVLDIGCHWGVYSQRLEDMGFRCVAVEAERRNIYFLRRLRQAHEAQFEIFPQSVFNYRSDQTFDLVLALYIFHHFLKTEDGYGELKALLSRLKMRAMIMGCHNPEDKQMHNAYRNYGPQEMIEFCLRHTGLKSATCIGEEMNRKLYVLKS